MSVFSLYIDILKIPLSMAQVHSSFLSQVDWLNKYHKKTRKVIGAELLKQHKKNAYQWLMRETEPLLY